MVADPTREEILAAKARAEMATKEPWGTRPAVNGSGTSVTADGTAGPAWCGVSTCSPGHSIGEDEARNNAIFIAAARTDVPTFADLALRQMDEIGRLDREYVAVTDDMIVLQAERDSLIAARTDVPALADLVLRQMDEIEKLQSFSVKELALESCKHHLGQLRWAENEVQRLRADLAAARATIERVEAEARTFSVVDARLTPDYQAGWNDAVNRVAEGMGEYSRAALAPKEDG